MVDILALLLSIIALVLSIVSLVRSRRTTMDDNDSIIIDDDDDSMTDDEEQIPEVPEEQIPPVQEPQVQEEEQVPQPQEPAQTYEMLPQTDFPQNDIKPQRKGASINELKEFCDADETCVGFNTNGYLKYKLGNKVKARSNFYRKIV